jgi:DNA invertase Pin-like site-specific DNA recombinase
MTISAAIYARFSPDCSITADQQVEYLRTIATEHGWTVVGVFIDHPMTVKRVASGGRARQHYAMRSGMAVSRKFWSGRSTGLAEPWRNWCDS